MQDDGLVGAWLGQKGRSGRKVSIGGPPPSGHDEDFRAGPEPIDRTGQFISVGPRAHIDVRQEDAHGQAGVQDREGLVAMSGFNHPETGFLEKLGQEKANEGLVLNQKYRGRIVGHLH
jgi:hypothetical protein